MKITVKNTWEYFNELIIDFDTWREYLDFKELKIIEMWISGKTNKFIGTEIGCSEERVGQIIRGTNRYGKDGIIARLKQRKRFKTYSI
jgi:hypothetical protein